MVREQSWDINISDLQSYMLWVSQQRAYLDLLNTRVAKTADATYELFFRGVSHSSYKNIPLLS